jgi:hypothetical protein
MGLGQTVITTFFLVLLTIAAVNANKLIIDKSDSFYQQEAYRQATVAANELLNEISVRSFDMYTYQNPSAPYVTIPSNAFAKVNNSETNYWKEAWGALKTQVNINNHPDTYPYKSLGYNSSLTLDAVEHYEGYVRWVWVKGSSPSGITLKVKVRYVDQNNPDVIRYTQQYVKKIFVTASDSGRYITNADGTPKELQFSALTYYKF